MVLRGALSKMVLLQCAWLFSHAIPLFEDVQLRVPVLAFHNRHIYLSLHVKKQPEPEVLGQTECAQGNFILERDETFREEKALFLGLCFERFEKKTKKQQQKKLLFRSFSFVVIQRLH